MAERAKRTEQSSPKEQVDPQEFADAKRELGQLVTQFREFIEAYNQLESRVTATEKRSKELNRKMINRFGM